MAAADTMSSAGREVILEDPNQCYRWGNLIVAPKPTEQMLALFYLRMEADKRLDIVFHSGVPSLSWFLQKYQEIETLGCYEQTDNGLQLQGMGWFNAATLMGEFKKAEVGECFVKGLSPVKTLNFAKMMLEWAFRHLGVDVLHGATPVPNRAGCLFMQKLGFEWVKVGSYFSYNGVLSDAEISWMTKDRWSEICPFVIETA